MTSINSSTCLSEKRLHNKAVNVRKKSSYQVIKRTVLRPMLKKAAQELIAKEKIKESS